MYLIAFNVEQRRPGCVIIQADMGGTVPDFTFHFPPHTWLLSPVGMRLYPISPEQLPQLVAMAEAASKAAAEPS